MASRRSGAEAGETQAAISQACEKLLFPSETDAPITPLFWTREQMPVLTAEALRERLGLPADAPVKEVAFADFFAGYDPAQGDPADPQQQATLGQLQKLKEALAAHLTGLTVFRVGRADVSIYILGLTSGSVAGVQTRAVET